MQFPITCFQYTYTLNLSIWQYIQYRIGKLLIQLVEKTKIKTKEKTI